MGWPKGKPRPRPSNRPEVRADRHYKTCASCGEEKTLNLYPYRHWRKGWRKLRAADPEKYADSCKDCTRAKNAVEVDPDFNPDRGRGPGRPRKDGGTKKQTPADKRQYRRRLKRKIRSRARVAALRYLAKKGCESCGCHDPRVLEFDHLDPKKKHKTISLLISQGYSWSSDRIRKEVRKCRVLCANCHRLHTVEQQGYYEQDAVRTELDAILTAHGIDP
jgi:hypothetical protein